MNQKLYEEFHNALAKVVVDRYGIEEDAARYWGHNIGRMAVEVLEIFVRAEDGDRLAIAQARVLNRAVRPGLYDASARELEQFADAHDIRPAIARGSEVRRKMAYLSWFLSPSDPDHKSLLDGPVHLRRDDLRRAHPDYKYIKQFWNDKATLQSMAVRICADQLSKEGIEIETRTLERDLKKLEEWFQKYPSKKSQAARVYIKTESGEEIEMLVTDCSGEWKWRYRTRKKDPSTTK